MATPQELYYKATQLNGTDFWTGTVNFARALETGETIRHPRDPDINPRDDYSFFSVSATPGDTLGDGIFDTRLFVVRPVGAVVRIEGLRRGPQTDNWRGISAFQVVEERPITDTLGRNALRYLKFIQSVLNLQKQVFWELAGYYTPLPDGVGARIWDATRKTGIFATAHTERKWVYRRLVVKGPQTGPEDLRKAANRACTEAGWGILTRGLIPAEYTALLMRTWRKTFGADYA